MKFTTPMSILSLAACGLAHHNLGSLYWINRLYMDQVLLDTLNVLVVVLVSRCVLVSNSAATAGYT